MLGGRAGAAWNLDVHVVELIRDLGTSTCEIVVEADQEVWPRIGMVVGHGDTPGTDELEEIQATTRRKNLRGCDHSPIAALLPPALF
jgi:hypothetical protein